VTWRPLRSGPEGREPRLVGESLVGTSGRLGVPDPGVLGAVFARWDELVGPEVAAHVRPRSLRHGVLTVEVDQPAWAVQLRYLAPEVLARVEAAAGPEGVSELQIRVTGHPDGPEGRRRGQKRRPDPPSW
jgi:predicted nucleic acid-binding Zn ribbon protein